MARRPATALADQATGRGAGELRVQPPASSGPRRRVPEMVLGVLLVAGCGLGALLLATGGRDRTPVVALAGDIARGEVVTDDDLALASISADSPVAHVDQQDRDDLVGGIALAALPEGTIVTPEQFAPPGSSPAVGDGTVGLALEAGQIPSLSLAPGDLVTVVAGAGAPGARAGALVEAAEVVAATRLDAETDGWWVSLRTTELGATAVAEASAAGSRLQLVLVER